MKILQKSSLKLIVLLVVLLATACGSRKLKVDQTTSTVKTENAVDVKTSTNAGAVTEESTVHKTTTTDRSKITEDEHFKVNADSASYNLHTGNVALKGNVSITGNKKKLTEVDYQVVADAVFTALVDFHTSELRDSSVLEKTETKTKITKKDLNVKRGLNWWWLTPVGIIALILFLRAWKL